MAAGEAQKNQKIRGAAILKGGPAQAGTHRAGIGDASPMIGAIRERLDDFCRPSTRAGAAA
eukprot:9499613-Pyramimonas_sp.AAC.1